jgi:hypothetical protein
MPRDERMRQQGAFRAVFARLRVSRAPPGRLCGGPRYSHHTERANRLAPSGEEAVLTRATILATFLLAAACGSNDVASAPQSGAETATTTLAQTIELDDVGFYQAVKVGLFHHGEVLTPNAPVIPGRPAFVRVSMRAPKSAAVKDRRFVATLNVHRPGTEDVVVTDVPRRIVPLQESLLYTTFNFELDATLVTRGLSIDVTVRDVASPDDSVTFPAEPLAIETAPFSPVLKVRFVPVRYEGDGSGRLPMLDPKTVEEYRRTLFKLYPVSAVEIDVRSELSWPLQVWADGSGWDRLLSAVMETRADDAADDDVYYVGIVSPAPSRGEFCSGGGCVLGLAPLAELSDVDSRVAMVLGYEAHSGDGTLPQELAHAMGRGHAPCGVRQGLDRAYPYGDATIGVFGWDLLDKKIHDPEGSSRDFMSYCHPAWISDYTFDGLYQRMLDVHRTRREPTLAPDVAKVVTIDRNGQRHEGGRVRLAPGARRGARQLPSTGGTIVFE